jgi:hypothetical protein
MLVEGCCGTLEIYALLGTLPKRFAGKFILAAGYGQTQMRGAKLRRLPRVLETRHLGYTVASSPGNANLPIGVRKTRQSGDWLSQGAQEWEPGCIPSFTLAR